MTTELLFSINEEVVLFYFWGRKIKISLNGEIIQ